MRARLQAVLATAALVLAGSALAQDSTMDEIAKYREMLADGNPAVLFELSPPLAGVLPATVMLGLALLLLRRPDLRPG